MNNKELHKNYVKRLHSSQGKVLKSLLQEPSVLRSSLSLSPSFLDIFYVPSFSPSSSLIFALPSSPYWAL